MLLFVSSYSIRMFNMNTYYFQSFFKKSVFNNSNANSLSHFLSYTGNPEYRDLDENTHDSKTIVSLTGFILPISSQFNEKFKRPGLIIN